MAQAEFPYFEPDWPTIADSYEREIEARRMMAEQEGESPYVPDPHCAHPECDETDPERIFHILGRGSIWLCGAHLAVVCEGVPKLRVNGPICMVFPATEDLPPRMIQTIKGRPYEPVPDAEVEPIPGYEDD